MRTVAPTKVGDSGSLIDSTRSSATGAGDVAYTTSR
jgi:hypothetical protein